jgi:endonuclease YncB( thermonuclease family)
MERMTAIGAVVLVVVAIGAGQAIGDDRPPADIQGRSLGSSHRPAAAAVEEVGPGEERVDVTGVVDGDTFVVEDGRTVRLLGVASCPLETPAGRQARRTAESRLLGEFPQRVTLVPQPGVHHDEFGRLLRYVELDGHDFGEYMVQYDHTGIADPAANFVSNEYLGRLYAADLVYATAPPSGRNC